MWKPPDSVLSEQLGEGLVMRTPAREEDVDRIAAFNVAIHGAVLAPMTRSLLLDYPGMEAEDQVFVENGDGEIVSALCLIPWTWRCEGTPLRAGEMGIVGTAESYRARGLVRAQVGYFQRRLRERACVLSHIQGIGYFYRQFGYQYAIPLEGGYRLELRYVPTLDVSAYTTRRATVDDIPALAAMYERLVGELCFCADRSADVWRYLMMCDDPTDGMFHETWLVEDSRGAAQAYMRIPAHHFGDELVIDEAYVNGHEAAVALLQHAKHRAEEGQKPGLRLSMPPSSHLVRLALAHGGSALGTYSWQIHIPDDAALLAAMAPALEARLAVSPFAGWTGLFRISFYTRALALAFENGSLRSVGPIAPPDEWQVRMPYAAFPPLVLSDRNVDELRVQYPDLDVYGASKVLLETLFPKRESHIYTAY